MPNYSEGKIYKIVSEKTSSIYVGSTTQTLKDRFRDHKSLDCSSRELLNFDDAKIVLIENYPCESWHELRIREEYHRVLNKEVCVNLIKAFTSEEEKAEASRKREQSEKCQEYRRRFQQSEEGKESKRKYNLTEKGKKALRKSEENRYRPFLCECGSTVVMRSKTRHLKSKDHCHSIHKLRMHDLKNELRSLWMVIILED